MVHTGETRFRAIRLQMPINRHIRNLSRIPTHFMPIPLMRMQNLTPMRMPSRTQDRPTLVHRLARMLEARRFPETQFRVSKIPLDTISLEVLEMVLATFRLFMFPGLPHMAIALVPQNHMHTATAQLLSRPHRPVIRTQGRVGIRPIPTLGEPLVEWAQAVRRVRQVPVAPEPLEVLAA